MYKNIKVILFDLGGVLIELTGVSKILEWMRQAVDENELWTKWLLSPAVRQYESGKTTAAEFGRAMVEEFRLTVGEDKFLQEFKYFPKGFYKGAKEILKELSKFYNVACFSNTNEIHWERLCIEDNIEDYIPQRFLSFKMGMMKPDREAFQYVIDNLGINPEGILYFDDNRLNVDMGNEVGMRAVLVKNFDELLPILQELLKQKTEGSLSRLSPVLE